MSDKAERAAELERLQAERKAMEDKASELWSRFCRELLDHLPDDTKYESYDVITKTALEYGQTIRKAEWANDRITRHLFRGV